MEAFLSRYKYNPIKLCRFVAVSLFRNMYRSNDTKHRLKHVTQMTRRDSGGNDATKCGGKHGGKRCNKLLENVKNRLLVASANELQLKSKCNEDGYPREIDCA